ncbi:cytochrome P450 188A3 Cyp188A3 [Mycobacteroides abscessus]|uniref:cytochrome P450 n=2 Tax=Mycobacteroides abscessus TaxID=36809 RepID=UPI0002D6F270|nr:cytochrome P450 [Mycobacteroides abscessus]CPT71100.1 cytochrome P450 188A3 Cyp188A3 [Mycobacteroides abscessus]CPU28517.1 cytochrome P450 188A3 Cyp188A3 [Mycobacteroides abscessus]SKI10426.1 cytochrome P450 188A3 Cyp188A3 [Mycobacteroides abscessus subsp. massiliense]SKK68101.1 cytochrome P450 188A3 Cyp188A3 [Mycobacteroides abscessus subsp. massiliense]SKM27772.1 cytochrome P450 188A3 Cyp188A3 [Mycobacteroides abscessus subsp. massiliense]
MVTTEAPEVDFDHHSPEYQRDPWAANIAMNTQCPVAHSSHHGGFWVVTGYDQVASVARRPEVFSSAHELPNTPGRPQGTIIPASTFRALPLEMDPPEFLQWRRALNRFFSPTAARELRPRIEAYARWCIDQHIEDGAIDLVLDLSNAVPALLTLDLVGLPMDDWRLYAEAVHSLAYTPSGTPEYKKVEEGFAMLIKEVIDTIPKRRADPREDLISFLVQLEIDGEKISDSDIIAVCNAMIAGGMDTTTALLASTFEYLDRNHDARQRLRNEPETIPKACEEFLRYFTPVACVGRTAMQDDQIGETQISAGERVMLSWAAANLDATVFPDPLTIDFDRDTTKHAAFGIGAHRCIGRHIAQSDFQVVVGAVLERLPDYQLVPGAAQRYPTVGQINGYIQMPAQFTPGPQLGPHFQTAAQLYSSLQK